VAVGGIGAGARVRQRRSWVSVRSADDVAPKGFAGYSSDDWSPPQTPPKRLPVVPRRQRPSCLMKSSPPVLVMRRNGDWRRAARDCPRPRRINQAAAIHHAGVPATRFFRSSVAKKCLVVGCRAIVPSGEGRIERETRRAWTSPGLFTMCEPPARMVRYPPRRMLAKTKRDLSKVDTR